MELLTIVHMLVVLNFAVVGMVTAVRKGGYVKGLTLIGIAALLAQSS